MTLKPRIGFLDLPAEIRNEIYAHLIENVDTNVGHKTIRLRPQTEFSRHWRRRNPHRGEVYALNQVCRATRQEFGPLYVSQIAHRIRVDEQLLPKFLHDFFLGGHEDDGFALIPKRIEIELIYTLGGRPPHLNILPLLTLCLGNEDLQCTFLNKFGPMPELDSLFWGHAVAWGDAILDDLVEILLYTAHVTTTNVDLVFRDDAGKEFMEHMTKKKRRAPRSMNAYLMRLGGVNVETWNSRVEAWNPQAVVEFAVFKRTADDTKRDMNRRGTTFETHYRLIEN